MYNELTIDNAAAVCDLLVERVDAFVAVWESGELPGLGDHLPADASPALRRLVLTELVKVDLEYRWLRRREPKKIEAYLAEFAELREGGLPCDLVYEEFQVRRQAGENVHVAEYLERFPDQADELARLLGTDAGNLTTLMVAPNRPDDLELGQWLDDFDLLVRLGRGAFAQVFLARQRSMQRLVALKVSADRGSEPQTLAQLDHPHIVRVFDQRTMPERRLRLLYMQYVPGGTLDAVVDAVRDTSAAERSGRILLGVIDSALATRGESPPSESSLRRRLAGSTWAEAVAWLGSRLAAALAHAHAQGVLHRDVKPANVLLAADGTPKLADFNISFGSKVDGATPAAYFGGSLAYMSPEQLEACNPRHPRQPEELDGRSDVYSLAVMLWELLAGQRPFADEAMTTSWPKTLEAMVARRQGGVDIAALAAVPGASAGLDRVLAKALAADRDQRYASACELAAQLRICLEPRAREILLSPRSKWLSFARRHAIWALVVAGVAPNAFGSLINIKYNWEEIIRALHSEVQQFFLNQFLLVFNVLAFGLGIAVILPFAWPLAAAALRTYRGEPPPAERTRSLRRRSLRLGEFIAAVSLLEWLASGIAIPLALVYKGAHDPGLRFYVQFAASQVMCGLIAASLAFSLVTLVSLHAVYPGLLQPGEFDDDDRRQLERTGRNAWIAFGIAGVTPFVAAMVLALMETKLQATFGALGLVGLLTFGATFALARAISADVAALLKALGPEQDAG